MTTKTVSGTPLIKIKDSISGKNFLPPSTTAGAEESYAQKLQVSTNPAYIERFEQTMDLLKEALQSQPND